MFRMLSFLSGIRVSESPQNRAQSIRQKSRSADEFLCDLCSGGEGGLAEGESVPSRLEFAFGRTQQRVGLHDVQLRGGFRALGLRLRLAGLGFVQRGAVGGGGGGGVEVRARGDGAQPGVG